MTATTAVGLAAHEGHRTHYAGFSYRLAAGLVDFIVLTPVIAAAIWAMGIGPVAGLAASLVSEIAYFAYVIVGHARWGQTLGKRAAGIRVLDVSGRPIGWRQAVRRSSVDIALSVIAELSYWAVMWRILAEFPGQPWADVQERFYAIRPAWVAAIEYLYFAWLGSEIVSVLFNKRRRALHDFIGGTVVVVESRRVPMPQAPLPGWRGVLSAVDQVLVGLGVALGILLLLGAATVAATESDRAAALGLAAAGGVPLALAAMAWGARRLLRSASPAHWALHVPTLIALLALILPVLALLFR